MCPNRWYTRYKCVSQPPSSSSSACVPTPWWPTSNALKELKIRPKIFLKYFKNEKALKKLKFSNFGGWDTCYQTVMIGLVTCYRTVMIGPVTCYRTYHHDFLKWFLYHFLNAGIIGNKANILKNIEENLDKHRKSKNLIFEVR